MASNAFEFIFKSNPQVIDALKKQLDGLEQELNDINSLMAMGGITNEDYTKSVIAVTKQQSVLQKQIDQATSSLNSNTAAAKKAADEAERKAAREAKAAERAAKAVDEASRKKEKAEERAAKAASDASAKASRGVTTKLKSASYAIQDFAATSGDLGQKLNSVSNNLQTFLEGFGKVGIGIGVGVTVLIELIKNWEMVSNLFRSQNPFPQVAETVDSLTDKINENKKAMADLSANGYGNSSQIEQYNKLLKENVELEERKTKAMEAQKAIEANKANALTKDEEQQKRDLGETVSEITAGKSDSIVKDTSSALYKSAADDLQNAEQGLVDITKNLNDTVREMLKMPMGSPERSAAGDKFSSLLEQRISQQKIVAKKQAVVNQGASAFSGEANILLDRANKGDLSSLNKLVSTLPESNPLRGRLQQASKVTDADVARDEKYNEAKVKASEEKYEEATDEVTSAFIDMYDKEDKAEKDKAKKAKVLNERLTKALVKNDDETSAEIDKFAPAADQFLAPIRDTYTFDRRQGINDLGVFKDRFRQGLMADEGFVERAGGAQKAAMRADKVTEGVVSRFNDNLAGNTKNIERNEGLDKMTAQGQALKNMAQAGLEQSSQVAELMQITRALQGAVRQNTNAKNNIKSQASRSY